MRIGAKDLVNIAHLQIYLFAFLFIIDFFF